MSFERSITNGSSLSPRPPKFAFYLDENFPEAAGKFFSDHGHRVYDGKRMLGFGQSDIAQLTAAIRRKAILVSFDKDFFVDDDLRARVSVSPGVILMQSARANLNDLRIIIARVLKDATPNMFSGKVCSASIDRISFL